MKRRGGYTLIELVLVLMLLVLVASVVFTLAVSGSQTYLRMNAKQAQEAELRVAISYLDVQLRKHDAKGALSISPDPFDSRPSILITQDIDGQTYLTWLYLRDGYLCELFVDQDTIITSAMGSRISPVDDMELYVEADGSLRVTLRRQSDGQAIISASRWVTLRAGGVSHDE